MASHIKTGALTTYRDVLPSSSRYELLVKVASGGMATVYVGRLSGAVGFWRHVAVKRAHAHLLEDPAFTRMLIEEARLASKIHHPNVVAVQDVEELEGELLLVMDYIEGSSLSALIDTADAEDKSLSARMVVRIVLDACAGLHAAHELKGDDGVPLDLVHRDVSPHNILVGLDGIARIADFGIAKCTMNGSTGGGTATGALKGKVAYMAPEYIEAGRADARSDVFALGIVLWEGLTRRRLFRGQNDIETLRLALAANSPPLSSVAPWLDDSLDAVVAKALARDPEQRFSSAQEFGDALESAARKHELIASYSEVGDRMRLLMGDALDRRRSLIRERAPQGAHVEASAVRSKAGASEATDPNRAPTSMNTLTLPTAAGEESIPVRVEESSTLGSGVSARQIERDGDPRQGGRTARRTTAIAGALIALTGALAAFSFLGRTAPQAGTSSASASPTPTTSATIAVSAANEPEPLAIADAGVPPTATSLPTAATATLPAATSVTIHPSPARPRPVRPTPVPGVPPPRPTPTGHGDKAPPNPYAPRQ